MTLRAAGKGGGGHRGNTKKMIISSVLSCSSRSSLENVCLVVCVEGGKMSWDFRCGDFTTWEDHEPASQPAIVYSDSWEGRVR